MDKINSSINAPDYSTIYRPVYFRLINPEEEESLKALIKSNPALTIYDTILSQLAELIKLNNPQKKTKSGRVC